MLQQDTTMATSHSSNKALKQPEEKKSLQIKHWKRETEAK